MVSQIPPIQPSQIQAAQKLPQKTTKTSIFYVNDVHSNLKNIEKLKTASDEFDTLIPSSSADKLKFSAGDFYLSTKPQGVNYSIFAQNQMGIMANAEGNHEFDLTKKDLVEVLKNNQYKNLALNLEIPQTTEENKTLAKEIEKSYIQEINGTKYGVIGLLPFDFTLTATHPQEYDDFNIANMEKTIPLLQNEINKFKEQGVDKIILLSHTGYKSDVKIAQSVEGIDVILGGHTHDLIKGIEEGKNLFYSKKTGEPTIITQAGKNGEHFGVLNLEFNDKGVIVSAQNNVNQTEPFPKSSIMTYFTDKFFGKPQIVGKINSVEDFHFSMTKENPHANFINDAVKSELGVDVVIMNTENMRSKFETGTITDRDLSGMTPFKNGMCILPLTEKEIVDALKVGAKSAVNPDNRPGILQVSGLKYKMNKEGELLEASFIDKNSTEIKLDVNNPNLFKTYKVAADSYLVRGGNGYLPDKRGFEEQKFDYDKDKIAADFIKKQTTPIDIKSDGRITVVE